MAREEAKVGSNMGLVELLIAGVNNASMAPKILDALTSAPPPPPAPASSAASIPAASC